MNSVIIVAGGTGKRFKSEVPKQFHRLAGLPILMHSILAFRKADPHIRVVVVIPEGQFDYWLSLCVEHQFTEPHEIVAGGATRFQSVRAGLGKLKGDGWVAIHDAVRPLITSDTISRLFEYAEKEGCAVPSVLPVDSIRISDGKDSQAVDRRRIHLIQTPQIFPLNKLKEAYVMDEDPSFTDDATVWEKAGNRVHLAEGQINNIKITTSVDLQIAKEVLLKTEN